MTVHVDINPGNDGWPTTDLSTSECPNSSAHTPQPFEDNAYMAWCAWADEMSKTHKQCRCSGCGNLAIWIPKSETCPQVPFTFQPAPFDGTR